MPPEARQEGLGAGSGFNKIDGNAIKGAISVPDHVGQQPISAVLYDLAGAVAPFRLGSVLGAPSGFVGSNTFLIQFDNPHFVPPDSVLGPARTPHLVSGT
jgi:hypothetical protein